MQIIDWERFIAGEVREKRLSLTVGVFDGVHLGHQALIHEICNGTAIPTVITFKKYPVYGYIPRHFPGNIYSNDRKLELFKDLGVKLTILIDFSRKFSKIKGRDFINLLLQNCHLEQFVIGQDFRCGYKLDTGINEIIDFACKTVKINIVQPILENGTAVSSSRIRNTILSGNFSQAAKLLGRNPEIDLGSLPKKTVLSKNGKVLVYDGKRGKRLLPADGIYNVYSGNNKIDISIKNGKIIIPAGLPGGENNPVRFEFVINKP